ncbi:hypothetical protein Fmac_005618 [Flemingia macrophylla]|uniref:protein-disulfide reductase n=1 Tax=Flemingia macrophylla TaxID=520843 RepID=A0ABD1N8N7_9FABA
MADSAIVTHDVVSLLSSPQRDFLLRNNNDQVYNEVAANGDFEVVFVTDDEDDESFYNYFSKMPWLAIPFYDSDTRNDLDELFHVKGILHLVLLNEIGKVVTEDGVDVMREYGVEAYPFTSARIQKLKDQEEEFRKNQSLRNLLIHVSEHEGKTVGLYFCVNSYGSCIDLTKWLKEVYEKLKAKGENFEDVFIFLEDDEESFKEGLESVPWLSLPFKDKIYGKLARCFELSALSTLVIISPNWKTLHSNVVEVIEEHGIDAYPFTLEKFAELDEIMKTKD